MSTTAVAAAPKPGTAPEASPAGEDASGTLAELLDTGKFAQYHLEKAKMALANGELAAADYQAAASLCHDHLPEAVAMRAEIKRRKAG